MEQLSKQLYDTLWQIENSIKSWKDDQIARHEYVYNSLFFPLFSNLEYVTKCIKESANLVQNQSQVGIGFVVQLCSTVPILYFFSSRAVWAMSNNPTNPTGTFRNDDDIILNFLVPPIFIQLFFCYKQPPSFYPFSVHSERLGIVSCSGPFEITTHSLRKIQFLAIFSSSSAQGEIIFPGCWELAITTAVKHISAPQNLQS